ncbi:MAG: Transcriptional regulator SlyA [Steroidobacteraceae bacterium]|nr:Transcriptional regulator SlyA [Steroidobacteraceae bacterium]
MPGADPPVGFLLADVVRLLRAEFNRRARSHGVTLAQAKVLLRLTREPGMRQVELAEILEIAPMTLVRLLDQLVRAGHVERRPDPADRRAFRLYVTPAAKAVLARIERVARDVRGLALRGLPRAERAALVHALVTIKHNLSRATA